MFADCAVGRQRLVGFQLFNCWSWLEKLNQKDPYSSLLSLLSLNKGRAKFTTDEFYNAVQVSSYDFLSLLCQYPASSGVFFLLKLSLLLRVSASSVRFYHF